MESNAFSISNTYAVLLSVLVAAITIKLLTNLWDAINTPGPLGLPLLGYYPLLNTRCHMQLHDMSKKYGEVYAINIVGQNFIYLSTAKAMREIHDHQSHIFLNRNNKYSMFYKAFGGGIFQLEGENWRVQRKFFTQSLRQIGLAANNEEMKGTIADAVKSILEFLTSSKGAPVDLVALLNKECTAVIIKLFLGNNVSEETALKFCDAYMKVLMPMNDINVLLVGELAKHLVLRWVPGYSKMDEGIHEMKVLLHEIVDHHKARFDATQPPSDFIDYFLLERATLEEKNDEKSKFFTDESLVGTLIQTYGDGSAAVGLFTSSYMYDLCHHLDAQEYIHEEIVKTIGTERLPTIEDKSKLPITNSVFKELLRISNMFSLLPGLECTKDTEVLGCPVRKGDILLTNSWGVQHNEEMYENPDAFDATRFVPDKPELEQPVTFGMGKRSCAGKGLVVAQMFSIIASTIQNFKLLPIDDITSKCIGNDAEDVQYVVRAVPWTS